jgi:NAD(P)-dependent dehydrogenase (short-subunit alcohol dehydrogenase family)
VTGATGKERTALVVGASRGIGLAIAERLLDDPAWCRVCATHRGPEVGDRLGRLARAHPERLVIYGRCEVTDDEALETLAGRLRGEAIELDLVMHCAGILHEAETGLRPEKALAQVDRRALARIFDVNAFSPLLLARAVFDRIPRQRPAHFAALSAMVGSIGDNRLGGWYGYRASKAALNQFLRTLANEARRTRPELCVTAIHPGTTDTDLSRPFQGNVADDRLYTSQQSAARILDVVLGGAPADSGRFMNWDGQPIPW